MKPRRRPITVKITIDPDGTLTLQCPARKGKPLLTAAEARLAIAALAGHAWRMDDAELAETRSANR